MVGDPIHMVRHRDAFLNGLTDAEYAIHEAEVKKGTMDKVMQILRNKDPQQAAADAEREADGQKNDQADG